MTGLAGQLGFARSLLLYRARPWTIARTARFYSGFVAPGDLAFDIGAHAGNRTRALLRAGARVVALEPQRRFFDFLAGDLPPEVVVLPLAAGRAPGPARLAVSRLHPTVSSIAPERLAGTTGFARVRWDETEPVEITTLDALIAAYGRPRFVKIDVEGYEPEVLAGLGEAVPWLAFEYLPGGLDAASACVARLAELGPYEFNLAHAERPAFTLPGWLGPDAILDALRTAAGSGRHGDVYARLRVTAIA